MIMEITMTVGGRQLTLSREKVINVLKGTQPESVRRYFIEVASVRYPIKQVFSLTTGLPRAAFTSLDAYRALVRLGFEVMAL